MLAFVRYPFNRMCPTSNATCICLERHLAGGVQDPFLSITFRRTNPQKALVIMSLLYWLHTAKQHYKRHSGHTAVCCRSFTLLMLSVSPPGVPLCGCLQLETGYMHALFAGVPPG